MRGLGGLSPTGQQAGACLHPNRGKTNICLTLKAPGAAAVMRRLIGQADVILATMRPRALVRLGPDPDPICARYPDKIHCLLADCGPDRPCGGFPTYDSVVQGATGLPGLVQARDGVPKFVPLLILDEPTADIAGTEVDLRFGHLRALRDGGVAIIHISHRLEEIFELWNRVTVFNDRQFVTTQAVSDRPHDRLVSFMVGRDMSELFPPKANPGQRARSC